MPLLLVSGCVDLPCKHETLTQCWLNVKPTMGQRLVFAWLQHQTQLIYLPTNIKHSPHTGSMLGQRLRSRAGIDPTLSEHTMYLLVSSEFSHTLLSHEANAPFTPVRQTIRRPLQSSVVRFSQNRSDMK